MRSRSRSCRVFAYIAQTTCALAATSTAPPRVPAPASGRRRAVVAASTLVSTRGADDGSVGWRAVSAMLMWLARSRTVCKICRPCWSSSRSACPLHVRVIQELLNSSEPVMACNRLLHTTFQRHATVSCRVLIISLPTTLSLSWLPRAHADVHFNDGEMNSLDRTAGRTDRGLQRRSSALALALRTALRTDGHGLYIGVPSLCL